MLIKRLLMVLAAAVLTGIAMAQEPRPNQPEPAAAEAERKPPARESAPARAQPPAPSFAPSEEIRADQAVAFPADI